MYRHINQKLFKYWAIRSNQWVDNALQYTALCHLDEIWLECTRYIA